MSATTAALSNAVEVVIAMGSNMGNRAHHIWSALRKLPNHGVQVYRQSSLYETYPAYVTDQPHFLNAAILATTTLTPPELLTELKNIEAAVGRDLEGGQRWGPRPIDLDIIFFGKDGHRCQRLEVPHPRWQERPFVKAPVADLLYGRDVSKGHVTAYPHNQDSMSISSSPQSIRHAQPAKISTLPANSVLSQLQHAAMAWSSELMAAPHHPSQHFLAQSQAGGECSHHPTEANGSMEPSTGPVILPLSGSNQPIAGDILRRVLPLGGIRRPDHFLVAGERTHVMGILNITPDSFSDGGKLASTMDAVGAVRRMAKQGATMIDVGGQSTRPGARRISATEESARVIPIIRALRADASLDDVLLSVDTFYAEVAKEAVLSGADIVNDVSGGTLDPLMLSQVAELGAPYIMNHMRGDPVTMQTKENTTYHSVWREVGLELQAAAERAMAAGIPAWNIILDPGIGFSKTPHDNVELMRHLHDLRKSQSPLALNPHGSPLEGAFRHAPILVGPSRKGFLGLITGQKEPAKRDAATVAACVACVASGADLVRVHNVADVADGMRVADAVYRKGPVALNME